MVNLDSPFARTIIQAFDNQKINERIFCNESSSFEKRNEPPHEFGNIPNGVQALCAEFTGDMMSWFSTIHFLDPDQVSLACKKRLSKLKNYKPPNLSGCN